MVHRIVLVHKIKVPPTEISIQELSVHHRCKKRAIKHYSNIDAIYVANSDSLSDQGFTFLVLIIKLNHSFVTADSCQFDIILFFQ